MSGTAGTFQLLDQQAPVSANSGYGRIFWDDTAKTFMQIDDAGNILTMTGAIGWGNISGTLSNQTDLQAALDSKAIKPSDVIVVNSLSDLPTPAAGSITLDGSKIYAWNSFVVIGSDHINLNGARLIGLTAAKAGIIHTGSGGAIRSTSGSVNIANMLLNSTNGGNVFDVDGGTTGTFGIVACAISQCASYGAVNNFRFMSMVRCSWGGCTTSGFSFSGVFEIMSARNTIFEAGVGKYLSFDGLTSVQIGNFATIDFTVPSGAQAISNTVTDSTNMSEFFRVVFCDFRGAGTYVTAGMRCHPTLEFFGNIGNSGTENSMPSAARFVGDGDEAATVIATENVPVLVAGVWTTNPNADECKFDDNNETGVGVFRYLGAQTSTLSIGYKMQIDPASGSNKEYWVYVRVHRWNGSGYDSPILDLQSRDGATTDSLNPSKVVGVTGIEMHTNDKIDLVIESKAGTTNVTCSFVSLTISD